MSSLRTLLAILKGEAVVLIKELATEVKYMRGDLNETVERLNKLEGKDGDNSYCPRKKSIISEK